MQTIRKIIHIVQNLRMGRGRIILTMNSQDIKAILCKTIVDKQNKIVNDQLESNL